MTRLAGRTALVTGAARGIGFAIAEAFLREGARVWLSDIDEAGLAAAGDRLQAPILRLDVRCEGDWTAAMAALSSLDVLVNNAGITGLEAGATHDPEHASLADWRAVTATNLDGTFLGCKHAIAKMRGRGGAIINIASRSGMVGVPAAAAYAASKAGIRNLTKSVALYCAENGLDIRCNTISPAAIMTDMWAPMLDGAEDRDAAIADIVKDTPLKRFGDPSEVAALAVMLAGDEATYMTGAELVLDGGLLAGSVAALKDD